MTFLAPWAGWFLAGVPVIIALYLLKLKRRPVSVSTLMFWQRIVQESRRRALFQRLRHLFSLLLHLLIFFLILAALGRPTLDHFVRAGSSTVLIIDARARMQAVDEKGEMRFEAARRLAGTYAAQSSSLQHIALLASHASPQVVAPFTPDEKPLRAGLLALQPSDASGDLHAAIALADQLLASRGGDRRIVVLTDAPPEDSHQGPAPRAELQVIALGKGGENTAISAFATRPLLSSPETSGVLLEVRNFGASVARGNVELSFDGKLLDVKPYELQPGGRRMEIFPSVPRATRGGRGWLTARLDAADALALDNVAYATLPQPTPRKVLLVSKGNWFIEKLLAADQQVTFELLGPEAFTTSIGAQFDVVIFDDHVPSGFDLATATGNFLFVKTSPFAGDAVAVTQPLITDVDAVHPLLRLVRWQNVTIVRASPPPMPGPISGWTFSAPLRSFEHPLLIAGTRRSQAGPGAREQRIVVLPFDITESDLPLRVAFPLLMANTVQWLSGGDPASMPGVRCGESVEIADGHTLATNPESAAESSTSTAAPTVREVFQVLKNGYYRLNQPSGASWIPVNMFSEAESDLRSRTAPSGESSARSASVLAAASSWPLWQYLALAAISLFALEWWLFHRRRTE